MKRTGKDWFKNEKEVMNLLGLDQVPGSGSSWIAREDGENDNVLCQLKSTDASSIRVMLQDIHELQINAALSKKLPVFAIQFRETNEVFLIVSPLDMIDVSKYLKDPRDIKVDISKVTIDIDDDWQSPPVVKSNSVSRINNEKERLKKFEKKGKSAI